MKREIVKIDRNLCNGCGDCIPNCHEGALQLIDGKATLVSELMCDGLGACIGHCPMGAITIEKREAEPYNETKVIEEMLPNGRNVIAAHLKHLKEHKQTGFLKEGVNYLKENEAKLDFELQELLSEVHNNENKHKEMKKKSPQFTFAHNNHTHNDGGCPGAREMSFNNENTQQTETVSQKSELRQWPVQMHLINPLAEYFQYADLLLAADCVAFSLGNFHSDYLRGKSLAIACPKLDNSTEIYLHKLIALIDEAKINTINVMVMQVPCCNGLIQLAQKAVEKASRKVPVKAIVVGIQGDILQKDWV